MAIAQNKIAAINIRALEEQRSLIDKAASTLNKTRSDFMLEAACQEAEKVLLDQRLFLADGNDFEAFQALLDAPTKDNNALKELLNKKSPWND